MRMREHRVHWIERTAGGRLRNLDYSLVPRIIDWAEDSVELAEAFGYCGA